MKKNMKTLRIQFSKDKTISQGNRFASCSISLGHADLSADNWSK